MTLSNYLLDTDGGFNYHYNSNQPRLHTVTALGEDVFLVTLAPFGDHKEILMLAHLVISAKVLNQPGYRYGQFRIQGDTQSSRYFSLAGPPLTPLLEQLRSIDHHPRPSTYAQSFQTLRKLDAHDTRFLHRFAQSLRPILRPTDR